MQNPCKEVQKILSWLFLFGCLQPECNRFVSLTQDVADAREVDLGSGLLYKDIRIGGGPSVQQGFLTVLHYRQPHFADSVHLGIAPS